jgi:predicted N-acetyltransferase YhbS
VIRRARRDELDALSDLARRSKAVWGYSEQFMAACHDELTVTEAELDEVFVLEVGGAVIGFYSLQPVSTTRTELGHLFVEPSELRRGHGRRLMADAIERARAAGCTILIIQGDPHTVDFYLAVGARKVGVRASASIPGRVLPLFELSL